MHASGWIERQSPTQHGCLQQPASRGERRCRLKVNRLAAMRVPRNVPHSHARHCHSSSSRTHAKTPRYLQTYRPRPHTQCTGGCMQRRDVMQLAFHKHDHQLTFTTFQAFSLTRLGAHVLPGRSNMSLKATLGLPPWADRTCRSKPGPGRRCPCTSITTQ